MGVYQIFLEFSFFLAILRQITRYVIAKIFFNLN